MRSFRIITTCLITMAIVLQASLTKADGDFYVGLLSYNNTEGLDCCGNQTDDSMCKDNCGLIFEVRVGGLNGTLHSKNLSSAEISLGEAISIPSNMTTNPLSFNFTEWPGSVNVTVVVKTIYNNRVNVLFDRFEHTFDDSYPTVFYYYSDVNSVFFGENSRLVILFRYQCRDLNGNGCFGDCLEHSDTEPCPPTEATPNNTYTWNKDHSCDETGNCSPDTTTPPDGIETTTDSRVDNNNISTGVTTRIYNDSGSSRNSTTESKDQISTIKQDPITITTAVYESQDGNNKTTESFTTTKINTISNDRITTDTLGKSPSTLSTILQSTQPTVYTSLLSTTPEEISTKIDDRNPVYWPAIVGGVLGGVAFLSAIGFLIYYRRQKKMRRRQEIYNVNPKVLRNFEEYEENGTSGRADVPLETEQY